MRVAVIGAGASGIISAKVLADEGISFDVFDCNNQVGGTWIYTENTVDKYGLPVPSSMYRDLRTNLPKEVMEFTGYHYDNESASYLSAPEVLGYLQSYTDKFELRNNIKFEHLVTNISRSDSGWNLTYKDLKSGKEETSFYYAVFVCNGHYSLPNIPTINGADTFEGLCMHSHYYKVPDIFKDKTVLIIGMGPSAQDITFNIAPTSKQVYLSHHGPDFLKTLFPENVIHKPDIKIIHGNTIYFVDETSIEVEAILYCTGYKFSFPFLNENCDIQVSDNYVTSLYKHIFSINHPTMVFIGIPFRSFLFPLFELQAKCAVNVLTGKVKLISKKEMLEEMISWENHQLSRGYKNDKFHMISEVVYEYFRELEKIGEITPYPNVLFKIFLQSQISRKKDLVKYRNEVFKIIDAENFIVK